jgi:hypothetical protein
VALVDDGSFALARDGSLLDMMEVFQRLRTIAEDKLGAEATQLSTRSATVLASSILEGHRRAQVAAFASNSMSYASEDSYGLRFSVLSIVGLDMVVVALDSARLFTTVFSAPVEAGEVLRAYRSAVLAHRELKAP